MNRVTFLLQKSTIPGWITSDRNTLHLHSELIYVSICDICNAIPWNTNSNAQSYPTYLFLCCIGAQESKLLYLTEAKSVGLGLWLLQAGLISYSIPFICRSSHPGTRDLTQFPQKNPIQPDLPLSEPHHPYSVSHIFPLLHIHIHSLLSLTTAFYSEGYPGDRAV